MYQYPYGDSQQLNLDWIINKLIELEQSFVAGESAELEEFANALISLTYIPTQAYNNSDIVFHDGHLYRCNTTIPAPGEVWDPAHWDQIMLGNTVANLVRAVAGMNSDHVFNESNVPGTHVTEALNALVEDIRYDTHKIQQKKNGAYTDVIPVEDTPSNNSDRLASSKAAYDLKGAIKQKQGKRLSQSKYVFVGDSYARTEITGGTTWLSRLVSDLGVSWNDNCLGFQGAGYGFYAGGTKKWLDYMLPTLQNLTDGDTYDYVIVCGGANDYGTSRANLESAMAEFFTAMKTYFPNAKYYCGFISWTRDTTQHSGFRDIQQYYKNYCPRIGVEYLQGCEAVMHFYPYLQNTAGNLHHPTPSAGEALGDAIFNAFTSGKADFYKSGTISIAQTGTHYLPYGSGAITYAIQNEKLCVNIPLLVYGNTGGTDAGVTTLPRSTEVQIGTYADSAIFGGTDHPINLCGTLYFTSNNVEYFKPCRLDLRENKVYLVNFGTDISIGFGGNVLTAYLEIPIMYD